VDGLYFKLELEKMVSVAKQIRHSHHVLVNKSDLINTNQLLEVIELIKNINPLVGITPISYGHVNFEKLKLEYYHIEDEVSINTIDNKPKSFLMKFIKEPTTQQLKEFLEQMPDYFYRIKGFIQITGIWYKVDLVNTQIEISPIEMKHFSNKKVIDQQVTDQQTTDFQGTNQQVIATKSDTNSEGFNELILLAAKGISSMSHMLEIAEKLLPNLYEIQV
jgi:G3E family GTPase